MMLMVEFDRELQESNDRFKISVKDMFPNLWGLGSDKLRKLSVLLLDVEKNPFFLMDYDMKIVQLSDRLGIRPEETKKHYDTVDKARELFEIAKKELSDKDATPIEKAINFWIVNKCSFCGGGDIAAGQGNRSSRKQRKNL